MRIRNEFCISLSEAKRKFNGPRDALIISLLHGEEVVAGGWPVVVVGERRECSLP